ncbi:HemK2/MTQ2 family protein methyltransferase [Actinokineospora iranica]|uniref:Release factor glutamine methyltransferase n=1 Tax=Actinokineospora iranica TaxID=1271860 RepID=A0A1G6RZV6_9PSEU|nr:HemK2/MTQ2 family protein methyltransferase [Actinokineospora iranica]SDD10200.1 release factor glutamine methyltransferase [Actinokineospora iranica]
MLLLRAPGVYRPQGDTHLLRTAFATAGIPRGGTVLDIGTGTGAMAITAARAGARHVTAVDVSHRAVWTARANALLHRLPIRVEHGDALDTVAGKSFDVVLSNPPYVPCASPTPPASGPARAWDAGRDGRAFLDRLCARAPDLLNPGGVMLIVHSTLCDVDKTVRVLRGGGLKAAVVARADEPFGPVMNGRIDLLEREGLIAPGQRHEELVVVRADRLPTPV